MGIQNILPQGLGSEMQLRYSNLGDAYKWNQLGSSSGLGIYALSAQIVDRAEPKRIATGQYCLGSWNR